MCKASRSEVLPALWRAGCGSSAFHPKYDRLRIVLGLGVGDAGDDARGDGDGTRNLRGVERDRLAADLADAERADVKAHGTKAGLHLELYAEERGGAAVLH